MTLDEAVETIYREFSTAWMAANPTSKIFFDNEAGSPPECRVWARTIVRETGSKQHSLGATGGRRFRRSGLIITQIFTKLDIGVRDALQKAEQARSIFEAVDFGGTLNTYNTTIRPVGADTRSAGKWYLSIVETQFDFDQTK